MERWQQDLDRYLTTEPNNGFNEYCEQVLDKIPEDTWCDWFEEDNDECNTELNRLHIQGTEPEEAAKLLIQHYLFLSFKKLI